METLQHPGKSLNYFMIVYLYIFGAICLIAMTAEAFFI
jgi:hypothetical protein